MEVALKFMGKRSGTNLFGVALVPSRAVSDTSDLSLQSLESTDRLRGQASESEAGPYVARTSST